MVCNLHAPSSSSPDAAATEVGSLLGLPGGVGTEPVFPRPRLPLTTGFHRTAFAESAEFRRDYFSREHMTYSFLVTL